MQVKKIMTSQVECVLADNSLADAAQKMKSQDVGALPVVDDGEPVGIVTDRDVVLRGLADGKDPLQTRVADVMTANPTSCNEGDDLVEAAELMATKRVRRLLVRNSEGQLRGILSVADMAREGSVAGLVGRTMASVCGRNGRDPS